MSGIEEVRRQARHTIAQAGVQEDITRIPVQRYEWLSAPDSLEIVSTSDEDGPGLTGIRSVTITLLESGSGPASRDLWSQEVSVTLNGTTPVTIPAPPTPGNNWFRCNGMRGALAGSAEKAVGTITLNAVTGGEILSQIEPGDGNDSVCIFTIPIDEITTLNYATLALFDVQAANANAIGLVEYRYRGDQTWNEYGSTPLVSRDHPSSQVLTGAGVEYPVGTDVRFSVLSGNVGTIVVGSLGYLRRERSGLAL